MDKRLKFMVAWLERGVAQQPLPTPWDQPQGGEAQAPPFCGDSRPFAPVTQVNDTWCLDFKGWFRTGDACAAIAAGERCLQSLPVGV